MKNEKFIKSSVVIDRILKIIQGFMVAGVVVAAIFIPLTAILGDKIIADASTVEFGTLSLALPGNFRDFLDMGSIKLSIIVMLVSALITCAVAWYCLKKLREIMIPMKDGRPFEAGVGSQIRRLAFTVLIGGGIAEVCRTVANAFEVKAYDLSKLFNPDVVKGISFDYDISLWFVVVALVLLFVSYIFRYGEDLQRESDETL